MSTSASEFRSATPAGYQELVSGLRTSFATGMTHAADWRRSQLDRLEALVRENQTALAEALHSDLGKCASEAWLTDIGLTLSSIKFARKNLRKWMSPEPVRSPITLFPARSW
ncbi:MAG TPA: hypothetical protein VG498_13515, partial [Terriglobales bacterium]|nr:hypothetical protein [Terriglobales bacterium]